MNSFLFGCPWHSGCGHIEVGESRCLTLIPLLWGRGGGGGRKAVWVRR